nr:immunoglobulin heavy chain junction region [Macaca mulatta]MOW98331.1 immunoglobulin heavy chain junction region [Macaca mulatta]MOW99449.1 immunoglobulin heavy chain junction region [Macaca mulatta]MOW99711.1 immunoglobulin heavy chain junction region [Macaca mulatta]MOX00147.1 immunoglobulin heavy chain junction region [Macaca mulatta]
CARLGRGSYYHGLDSW